MELKKKIPINCFQTILGKSNGNVYLVRRAAPIRIPTNSNMDNWLFDVAEGFSNRFSLFNPTLFRPFGETTNKEYTPDIRSWHASVIISLFMSFLCMFVLKKKSDEKVKKKQ